MSSGKVFLIIFLILLVGGVLIYFYYFYEKPAQKEAEKSYANLNIQAFNFGHNIESGYRIYIDNNLYKEGKTLVGGAILEKVPINSSLKLFSYNLDSEKFYTYYIKEIYTVPDTDYRADMKLISIGKLNVSYDSHLNGAENINLTLRSKGYVKNLMSCVHWSFNILNADLDYPEIDIPSNYNNYDKCYNLNITLDNEVERIKLHYSPYTNLDNDDYINIIFIDRDVRYEGELSEINDKDIGMSDVLVKLIF